MWKGIPLWTYLPPKVNGIFFFLDDNLLIYNKCFGHFFNGKCLWEFLIFMQNVNCPLILLISSLLSQVRSKMVINLCDNWDDALSEVANTIIVETRWYLLSQVTQISVQVYITQVGKMIGSFSIRIHLYFITGATTLGTFGSLWVAGI